MTIIFSNSGPKLRKSGSFRPKFKEFYFCTKLCNKANSRALIWNTKMAFQNCYSKHPNKAFLVTNLRILIFCSELCNQTNWRALITNMTIVLQHSSSKTQIERFWSQVYLFFCLFSMKLYSFSKLRILIKNLTIFLIKLQPKNT